MTGERDGGVAGRLLQSKAHAALARLRIRATAHTSPHLDAPPDAQCMSSAMVHAHRPSNVSVASIGPIGYLWPRMSPEPVRVTDADVDRVATQMGLVIVAERRAAVAQHLAALLDAIRLLEGVTLPETTEPAPRFEP
jgi:hypothetical protein